MCNNLHHFYRVLRINVINFLFNNNKMSVNALTLPTEVLQIIFKLLNYKELQDCGKVCRRWQEVVDGLGEDTWKKFCKNTLKVGQDVYNKARLSWRELCQTLDSWGKIRYASITTMTPQLAFNNAQQFELLSNGIIAVLHNSTEKDSLYYPLPTYSNCIVYYDAETFEECGRENIDFLFSMYKENEYLITVVHQDRRLCVIPKLNKERFYVGKIPEYEDGGTMEYCLIENKVYFKRDDNKICVSELEQENGVLTIQTKIVLQSFEKGVLAFSIYENYLKIFTNMGEVFSTKINELIEDCLDCGPHSIIYELESVGLNWSSKSIYRWLPYLCDDQETLHVTDFNVEAVCRFGFVVIMGLVGHRILIYPNSTLEPSVEIDMQEEFTEPVRGEIKHMDVYEMVDKHKILLLVGKTLHVIEFHNDYDDHNVQREDKTLRIMLRVK